MKKILMLIIGLFFLSKYSHTAHAQTQDSSIFCNTKKIEYVFRFALYDNLLADSGLVVKYSGQCNDQFFVKRTDAPWKEINIPGHPHEIFVRIHKTHADFSCYPKKEVWRLDYTNFTFSDITRKPGTIFVHDCTDEVRF